MEYKELFTEIDDLMELHDNGTIMRAGDVEFSAKKTIDKIGRFIQSKYLKAKDPRTGKVKRFKNVGNAIVDLEFRAKNIDRKAIEYQATDGDYVFSMIVNAHLQNWMKNNDFGRVIDEYQFKKSQYGSVTLKDSIKREDGKRKLCVETVPYSYAYFNSRDMNNGTFIEKAEMSPMELRKKSDVWDKEKIEEAIQLHKKEKVDGKEIEILDIDGEFPVDYFEERDTNDEYTTKYYNIICAKIDDKKVLLDYNEIKRSRYMSDSRKKVDGCDYGIGVWEEVFEPQQAINNAVIEEENAMDIAGKVVIKTNKQTNIPNAMSMVNGEMIYLAPDEYMESMSLTPSALPQFSTMVSDWFENMQRDQSSFAGMTGEEPKASTPFSSLALQSAQGGSIFNKRRDQDGFFLNKYLMTVVIPFIIDEINKDHTLTASFSPMELKVIDRAVKPDKYNKKLIDNILKGEVITPEKDEQLNLDVEEELTIARANRSITIPKGYITMKKIKDKGMIDITGEMSDSQRELNALATRLQSLPPEDPARKTIIDQMAEISGLSPISAGGGLPTENAKPQGQTKSTIETALPEAQQ